MAPTIHPNGIAHHIPTEPNIPENQIEAGIRIIQSASRVMNIGTTVAPAPRSKPPITNIAEKTI